MKRTDAYEITSLLYLGIYDAILFTRDFHPIAMFLFSSGAVWAFCKRINL